MSWMGRERNKSRVTKFVGMTNGVDGIEMNREAGDWERIRF